MAGTVLENVFQAHKFVTGELGFQVSYNTLKKHLVDQELASKRRGGGWSAAALKSYAETHLAKRVDEAPAGDVPILRPQEDPVAAGAATRKIAAHADVLDIKAQRERIKLRHDLGELIEAVTWERELAKRAQVFRYGLEAFAHQSGEDLADLFGGAPDLAREIVELVGAALDGGGTDEAGQQLQAWFAGRVPEFVQFWLELVDKFLEPYAQGTYYTDDMAVAMERWEAQHDAADDA